MDTLANTVEKTRDIMVDVMAKASVLTKDINKEATDAKQKAVREREEIIRPLLPGYTKPWAQLLYQWKFLCPSSENHKELGDFTATDDSEFLLPKQAAWQGERKQWEQPMVFPDMTGTDVFPAFRLGEAAVRRAAVEAMRSHLATGTFKSLHLMSTIEDVVQRD